MDKREKFRLHLSPLYIPAYDKLCKILPQDWQPYSGFRSIESQDRLFEKGRTSPGSVVTKARGGESAHNYGMATDWVIFDQVSLQPVWENNRWGEYRDAVLACGLKWGGDFNDRPHNQLKIGMSYKKLNELRLRVGLTEALKTVKEMLSV